MRNYKTLLIYIFFLSCALGNITRVDAQTPPPAVHSDFVAKSFDHEGKTLPYRILFPKNFDATQKYPLHLFLHGAGERGDDNEAQLIHGSQRFAQMNEHFPAIVIFPQCPSEDYWARVSYKRNRETNEAIFDYPEESEPTWAMLAVMELVDTLLARAYVDKERIYLSGLSMGGMGTFELLARRPNIFAAATPICGGGQPQHVSRWASQVPVWIFHGDSDTVVPARYSKIMVEALLENGIEPTFSLYPNVNHNSWDNAFAEPNLFSWIYSKKKSKD